MKDALLLFLRVVLCSIFCFAQTINYDDTKFLYKIIQVEINEKFGPPGTQSNFDALVLSHETLSTGHKLNEHRASIGLPKLKLLCTRRTEPNSMSSTALRRLRDKSNRFDSNSTCTFHKGSYS